MIGESIVSAGQLKLWHVTTDAIRLRDTARFGAGLRAVVTCETLRGVVRRYRIDFLMRIVACKTADPFVIWVKALAFSKPIRLKANVRDARFALRGNFRPGAMAIAAEVGHFLGGRILQLKRLSMCFMRRKRQVFFRGDVRIEIGMAMSALHAGDQGLQRKLLP